MSSPDQITSFAMSAIRNGMKLTDFILMMHRREGIRGHESIDAWNRALEVDEMVVVEILSAMQKAAAPGTQTSLPFQFEPRHAPKVWCPMDGELYRVEKPVPKPFVPIIEHVEAEAELYRPKTVEEQVLKRVAEERKRDGIEQLYVDGKPIDYKCVEKKRDGFCVHNVPTKFMCVRCYK